VDDHRQAVALVIRGADLLTSTGRQIRLGRLVGRAVPPVFLHHPVLLKPSGEKLSKSSRDTGVRDLRVAGLSPGDVIGRAAAAAGLLPAPKPVPASRVHELFD
jgi:glutamyl/glutaminyl-tRNA synthetase